jgi:hypothetical protein
MASGRRSHARVITCNSHCSRPPPPLGNDVAHPPKTRVCAMPDENDDKREMGMMWIFSARGCAVNSCCHGHQYARPPRYERCDATDESVTYRNAEVGLHSQHVFAFISRTGNNTHPRPGFRVSYRGACRLRFDRGKIPRCGRRLSPSARRSFLRLSRNGLGRGRL